MTCIPFSLAQSHFSLSLSLRWKSRLLWVSCLLGACVKYSCFSISMLVFYLSFFPFDVPSVKKAFMGPPTICFFFKLEMLLFTEDTFSVLLLFPHWKALNFIFLDPFYALDLYYFVWFYIFKFNFTSPLMMWFHSGKSPDFDFRLFTLANNLLFDRCCSPMGPGEGIKYILVLTLPKLKSKGERPVY